MNSQIFGIFSFFGFLIVMLSIIGIYCVLVTRNLMRTLIGIEILVKAVTLLLIVAGYVTNKLALIQVLVITLIVIEVVVVAIMTGVILCIFRHNNSLDSRNLKQLRG